MTGWDGRWSFLLVFVSWGLSSFAAACGDDSTAGRDAALDSTVDASPRQDGEVASDGDVGCNADNCAEGCCLDGACLASDESHCGSGGMACEQCQTGQHCTAVGCRADNCDPDCSGRCAGAQDGCGGTCPGNDCPGCCDETHQCLAGDSDRSCGTGGGPCLDCVASVRTCLSGLCVTGRARDAVFVRMDAPERLDPGAGAQVSVTMQNVGSETWTPSGPHRLGAQNPQDNTVWGTGRLELPGAVGPGRTAQFEFQIHAPSSPGLYHFQWRMLLESVEWFGEYSADHPIAVWRSNPTTCEAIRGLAGTQQDASAAIQACLDQAAPGSVVWLPVGRYRMDGPVVITAHPVVVQTEGLGLWDPPCSDDGSDCAVLEASTAFSAASGILQVLADGTVVDHLVIDGNKTARAQTQSGQQCADGSNAYGYNMRLGCDDCGLTNSVTKNALCGTGCEVSGQRRNVTLWRNHVLACGVHDRHGMWSDGVTVHDCRDCSFTENRADDGTDVDIIFGGCPGCIIQDNQIHHSSDFASSSFAALMLHAWADGNGNNITSGDFTGAVTWRNVIDCGTAGGCGFGLYLGADAWYIADVFGGAVYANRIQGAQLGLLCDDVRDMAVYDNPVSGTVGQTRASCGTRQTGDYVVGTRTANLDRSRDRLGSVFVSQDWDLCIPNWWDQ